MICLTGDVHQRMNNPEQSFFEEDEIDLAGEYSKIARKYNINVTLFMAGRAIKERPDKAREISELGNIEIGGHTWSSFRPKFIYKPLQFISGSPYGPRFLQKRDIKKTINVIKKRTDENPVSWRTHAYNSDEKTREILERNSIKVISDELDPKGMGPHKLRDGDIYSLPLNVMPDHEHIYHGMRDRKHVEELKRGGWKDVFSSKSYTIDKYFEIIKSQIEKIEEGGGIATVLLHPACMKIADDFQAFREFCKWIDNKGFETVKCRETVKHV